MTDFEKFKNAIEGKTIEDFIQKVKKMPFYGTYEHAVRDKSEEDTANLLGILLMLFAVRDEELSALMTHVSMDILFALVNQRLRNEILNDSEEADYGN